MFRLAVRSKVVDVVQDFVPCFHIPRIHYYAGKHFGLQRHADPSDVGSELNWRVFNEQHDSQRTRQILAGVQEWCDGAQEVAWPRSSLAEK